MNEQNNPSGKLELVDDMINSNSRMINITISELIGTEKESINVFSNLPLKEIIEIILVRVDDHSKRLDLLNKINLFEKQLKDFNKTAALTTEDVLVALRECSEVKKENDNLRKQIQDAEKEYLEFRAAMIKKYEDLEKRMNGSEGK